MLDWLFGSSETKNELPDWIVGPATEMLQRSVDMGKAGYMPWSGPVVAALDPAQVGAMRNNSAMAAAFGMDSTMPNIREATTYGDGTRGYSSMPLYNQNMNWLQETRPGQLDYYNDFFVDPVTGVPGSRMEQSNIQNIIQNTIPSIKDSPAEEARQNAAIQAHIDDVNARNGYSGSGGFGGYTSLGDMFDGGGPGASGDRYGGTLGGLSNSLNDALGGIF